MVIADVIHPSLVMSHRHDYRSEDLHPLANVPVETNGDEDHSTDPNIYKFQYEFDPMAGQKEIVMAAIGHAISHRPLLLRRLGSHRFTNDSLQQVDLFSPRALHQLRCIALADRLLYRAGLVIQTRDVIDKAISIDT